jgi:LDH2 family malate/lactate/ureidoglycolate dehydrogenase
VEELRLPGERSFKERAKHLREGIVIDKSIYDALLAVPEGKLAPLA